MLPSKQTSTIGHAIHIKVLFGAALLLKPLLKRTLRAEPRLKEQILRGF